MLQLLHIIITIIICPHTSLSSLIDYDVIDITTSSLLLLFVDIIRLHSTLLLLAIAIIVFLFIIVLSSLLIAAYFLHTTFRFSYFSRSFSITIIIDTSILLISIHCQSSLLDTIFLRLFHFVLSTDAYIGLLPVFIDVFHAYPLLLLLRLFFSLLFHRYHIIIIIILHYVFFTCYIIIYYYWGYIITSLPLYWPCRRTGIITRPSYYFHTRYNHRRESHRVTGAVSSPRNNTRNRACSR